MNIKLTGIKRIRKNISARDRAIAVATDKALRFTADRASKKARNVMQQVFDRPKPFTLNSVTYTHKRGLPYSDVFIKDKGLKGKEHYLTAQIVGGRREQKRAEFRLGGWWAPGRDAKLDKYGNITKTTWKNIIEDVNRTSERRKHFMGRLKSGRRVIISRPTLKSKKRIITAIEVSRPHYSRRLPFYKIVKATMLVEYNKLFDRYLGRELDKVS